MGSSNPRGVFASTFVKKVLECQDTSSLAEAKCDKGHTFRPFIRKVAYGLLNVMSKNFTAYKNDEVHASKKKSTSTLVIWMNMLKAYSWVPTVALPTRKKESTTTRA